MKQAFLLLLIGLLTLSCTSDKWLSEPSGNISIDELLSAPESVIIEGRKLFLKTEMWRDFMPVVYPEGQQPAFPGSPLLAIIIISVTDTTKLPSSIASDELWIINGNEIWNTPIKDISYSDGPLLKPFTIVKMVRNGPKWKTLIKVDVIVSIHDRKGRVKLLRAKDQWIGQTE